MAICESCGREEPSVTTVQRMYLAGPSSGDGPEATAPRELDCEEQPAAGEIEMWCASCCATFPHIGIDST